MVPETQQNCVKYLLQCILGYPNPFGQIVVILIKLSMERLGTPFSAHLKGDESGVKIMEGSDN